MELSHDFEWRSGADIGLGLPRYFADKESAPLCLGYGGEGAPPKLWVPDRDGKECPADLREHIEAGGRLRAWNALFEYYCLVWLHEHYGWPKPMLDQMVDTMAEAAAMNLPQGLGNCAIVLGLPDDQLKSTRGKYLIQKLCVPQVTPKNAKTPRPRWVNEPELLQELYDYCLQDVVAEQAAMKKLHRLSEYEQRVWVKTQEINLRGVPVDTAEISRILRVTDAEVERLNGEMKQLTQYQVTEGSKRQAVLDWCNARLPEDEALPDLQGETIEARLKGELPVEVRRALEIRHMVSQTSIAKLVAMRDTAAADGTLKGMLIYHGASTGRYASRGGVNLQNIVRPPLDAAGIAVAHATLGTGNHELCRMMWGERLMDAGVSTVRGVLRAQPGMKYIDADYSSVENRVSAWISGQTDKLEMFAQGLDEYKVFATELFNVIYEMVTKDMRQVSKSAVLGCMFGQGAAGLVDYAAGMGVELTLERSKQIVSMYRAQYSKVQALWYACGDAAIAAVETPGVWINAGEKLALACNASRSFLMMRLPSGRLLRWALPRVEVKETPWGAMRPVVTVEQVDSVTRKWRRDKLIGSSIFQSGVQATARDIQVQGLLNAEEAGYSTVLLIHDEILTHVPEDFGSPDELGALICKPADWYADLPLAFEAWEDERFHK